MATSSAGEVTPAALNPAENLKRISMENYRDCAVAARRGKFVTWIAIGVPVELLKGFDVVVAVPENHSALTAIRHRGAAQAEKAEAAGYSRDLCSYARVDIGTVLHGGEGSPIGGLPRPDLLISCTNNCSHLVKWFDAHHRTMGVPHFVLDVPFCYGPQRERDLQYILQQFHDLVRTLERSTGQTYDPAPVEAAFGYSRQAFGSWKRYLGFAKHKPSGITAFDTFAHMGPYITALRGTRVLANHFKLLADHTEERVRAGEFPVPDERYRLIWDNIAPWHQMRNLAGWLASRGANLVHATYTSCIGSVEGGFQPFPYDDPDPLRNLARGMNLSVCPYGLELRYQVLEEMIRELEPDGFVFSSNRSCKPYSLMQMDLARRVEERHGIPTVMVEVDQADERVYNEAQTHLRLEALFERIDALR
ncbi:MAG: 2-hydroxyacyl-CoA dehydratase subunit D [Promethearchaeota archaeon]